MHVALERFPLPKTNLQQAKTERTKRTPASANKKKEPLRSVFLYILSQEGWTTHTLKTTPNNPDPSLE